MKPLFYGLTIAASIAAGVFSFQLKGKFEQQVELRLKATDDTKKTKKSGDDELEKLNKEKDTLAAAKTEEATVTGSIEQLTAASNQLKKDISGLNAKLTEQKDKFAELAKVQERIKEIVASLPGIGGDPVTIDNLAEKVKEVETKRDAQKKELEELLTTVDGAKKNVADNQSEISRLADREADRAARFRHNSMESVVTAVNSEWGFIVIGAGSNTGFTPQTKLLIEREGRLIGEVKPSAIEPSQTIAEIDLDTIAPGARIQPGDRVILAEPATN